jgi:hypothetical protein
LKNILPENGKTLRFSNHIPTKSLDVEEIYVLYIFAISHLKKFIFLYQLEFYRKWVGISIDGRAIL